MQKMKIKVAVDKNSPENVTHAERQGIRRRNVGTMRRTLTFAQNGGKLVGTRKRRDSVPPVKRTKTIPSKEKNLY